MLRESPDGVEPLHSIAPVSPCPCSALETVVAGGAVKEVDFQGDRAIALADDDACDCEARISDELDSMLDKITHEATAEIIGGEEPTRSCEAAAGGCEEVPGASWHARRQAQCAAYGTPTVCPSLQTACSLEQIIHLIARPLHSVAESLAFLSISIDAVRAEWCWQPFV